MATTPVTFKRGSTFSMKLKMPVAIEPGTLKNWFIKAQLRRRHNDLPSGLVADISAYWADPTTATVVVLHHPLTDKWPLGDAELDVMFTSAGGQKLSSKTISVSIERGITRNA